MAERRKPRKDAEMTRFHCGVKTEFYWEPVQSVVIVVPNRWGNGHIYSLTIIHHCSGNCHRALAP